MITSLYAAILSALIIKLSFNVIRSRRDNKVPLGDGDCDVLIQAQSAQNNALNYTPLMLILLFLLETQLPIAWLIHLFGLLFLTGRLIHARAIKTNNLKLRVKGMICTFWTLIALASANIALWLYNFL